MVQVKVVILSTIFYSSINYSKCGDISAMQAMRCARPGTFQFPPACLALKAYIIRGLKREIIQLKRYIQK